MVAASKTSARGGIFVSSILGRPEDGKVLDSYYGKVKNRINIVRTKKDRLRGD